MPQSGLVLDPPLAVYSVEICHFSTDLWIVSWPVTVSRLISKLSAKNMLEIVFFSDFGFKGNVSPLFSQGKFIVRLCRVHRLGTQVHRRTIHIQYTDV